MLMNFMKCKMKMYYLLAVIVCMLPSEVYSRVSLLENSADSNSDGSRVKSVAEMLQQQTRTITGTVLDTRGEPVIGATIVVKENPTHGTVTNIDGHFSIANIPGDAILQISYVGMQTQEVAVSGRTSLEIILESDAELLDEIVVIGYGTVRKRDLTGAVSSIGIYCNRSI